MSSRVALLAALTGCAVAETRVPLTGDVTGEVLRGAEVWGGACGLDPIEVRFYPGLHAEFGADGLANRETRLVLLDPKHSGWPLAALAAHEIGHILLDFGGHLGPGNVMASGNTTLDPGPGDLELMEACDD